MLFVSGTEQPQWPGVPGWGVPAEGGFRSLAHSPRSGDLSGDPRVCRSFSSHWGGYQLSNSQPTRKGLFVPFCKQTPAAQWLQ